jgi:uracil-DNA glycosylase family 4
MAQLAPARGRRRDQYHSGPVNGFGDLDARICLVGLAPGAHGANRTGRPFTGDGAGNFMYPLLHRAGLASRAEAVAAGDGLELHNLYITNAVKCLPPQNKPVAAEFSACRSFLQDELEALAKLRVIIALGRGAYDSLLRLLCRRGTIRRPAEFPFAHGCTHHLADGRWLVGCYHTSRYNVQTRRINEEMFLALLERVKALAAGP